MISEVTGGMANVDPARGRPVTLEEMLRAGASAPDAGPAFADCSGVRATHHDLRRIRDGGRARLREAGVGPADHVAMVLPSDWWMAAQLLAAMCTCAVAPLDPGLSDREMGICLAKARPRAILTDERSAARLRSLAGEGTPILLWSVDDLDGPPDGEQPEPDATGLLLFTSGTTAAPKVARLSQCNLAVAGITIARTLRLSPGDQALNVMAMHHGHGIFPGVLAPLMAGGSTVSVPLTSADELLALTSTASATWYSAAPVMHHAILAMTRSVPAITESFRPRVIRSNSSALPADLLADLTEAFSAPVLEAYSLTEAPGQIASNPLDGPWKAGTVGPATGARIVLLTAGGELTDAPGSSGEVLVRGPNIMLGYLDVPDQEQPFLDGWLCTGDQGSLDGDGYLALGGRIVDFIHRGAELLSPAEVEFVLGQHPAVAEVVAFGRPHPTLGEAAAAVVLREDAVATEAELTGFAAQRLAPFKVPVGVYFVPAIPRGKTGKIVRRRVRELTERSAGRAGHRLTPPS